MSRYTVDTNASKLLVKARSSIHDTDTAWDRISGEVEADPDRLIDDGATARFEVDMRSFDAGDWLKNRKIKKDLSLDKHPTASFELAELRQTSRNEDGSFQAIAVGTLRWRGIELPLEISGKGNMDSSGIEAAGSFELDIRRLNVEPPKFLMFKVEPEVTVEITLRARAV